MLAILFFFVSLIASCIGAISGVGGGVLIKPILDATGTLSVSTISFLSGFTVLSMATATLLRSRKSEVAIDLNVTIFLGIGSAIGGILGKTLFEMLKNMFGNDHLVGIIQSVTLLIITICVFIYVNKKQMIKTYHLQQKFVCLLIGMGLGILSAFLGIGGGPINIAILYLLFSMDTKSAVRSSLYIIFFSQVTSTITTIATNNIPPFDPVMLVLMCIGGIVGGISGAMISKKTDKRVSEKVFIILLFAIMLICIYNIISFF